MTQKIDNKEPTGASLNALRWALVLVLLVGAFAANYHYATQPLSLRLIGWIAVAIASGWLALQTTQGARLFDFGKEAQTELRKVVWPTRQETVQTTLVVMVMVLVLGVILWGIDTFLLWAIGLLTGQ